MIVLLLLAAFIAINFFCFKYCGVHKVGGFLVYVANIFALVIGNVLPYIIYFMIIATLAKSHGSG
jgi:hypothetical protein